MTRLFDTFEGFGPALALIDEAGRSWSYAALAAEADRVAHALDNRPQLLVIEAANALAPLALYIGALRAGHAVLLAAPGGAARIDGRFAPRFRFHHGADGWTLEDSGIDGPAFHPDLAVLLSTSGSTGSPKLIRLSHANLIANAGSIAEYLALASGERAITSLPPYYSYGMSVLHSHWVAGHAVALTEASVTDPAFWDLVDRHGVTSFAGVPHSYDLLERSGFMSADHPSLRYHTQAGGRLSPEQVRLFADHASERGRRFYVMYGQTEAGPRMAWLPPEAAAAHPDCIGLPVPGGRFALDPLDDAAPGVGELVYHGPNVMMGYALAPEDLAAPAGPPTLRTGDVAMLTDAGYYRIVGRMSRFSKLFGLRIGLDDVEARLREAGHAGAVAGDDRGIVVALTDAAAVEPVTTMLAKALKLPAATIAVRAVDDIPRLPTGKTDYVSILALRGDGDAALDDDAPLRDGIARILGRATIADDEAFVTMGGDSLNYVQVSMLIEGHLGRLPDGWETMPVSELEALDRTTGGMPTLESGIVIRALAILLVVFHHVSEIDMAGAAFALLAVAGANFARFRVPQLETGAVWPAVRSMLLKVALPYYALLTLFFVYLRQLWWPLYGLFNNFTTGFRQNGVPRMQIYWFIETYIGLYLIVCALFLLPPVRRLSRERPWGFAVGLLAITTLLRLAGEFSSGYPMFYKNTPVMLGYVFALGWAIFAARTLAQRIGLALFSVLLCYTLPPAHVLIGRELFLALLMALIFVPRIPVGALFARLFSTLAAASLYIYIAHPLVLQPARKLTGTPMPALAVLPLVALCVIVGILMWRIVGIAETLLPRLASRRTRAG